MVGIHRRTSQARWAWRFERQARHGWRTREAARTDGYRLQNYDDAMLVNRLCNAVLLTAVRDDVRLARLAMAAPALAVQGKMSSSPVQCVSKRPVLQKVVVDAPGARGAVVLLEVVKRRRKVESAAKDLLMRTPSKIRCLLHMKWRVSGVTVFLNVVRLDEERVLNVLTKSKRCAGMR